MVSVVEMVDTLHCECSHCGFETRRIPQNNLKKTLDIVTRRDYNTGIELENNGSAGVVSHAVCKTAALRSEVGS